MSQQEIDRLKRIQVEQGLLDAHVVSIGPESFAIAHTESERVAERTGGPTLAACPLHQWLLDRAVAPVEFGDYIVRPHQPDGYSESYRPDSSGYDWEPLP